MAPKQPKAQLTSDFLARVEATGLTDAAVARAIGVTKQYYSAVKLGRENPSITFMVGAIHAGLADTFNDIAEPIGAQPRQVAA